MAYLHPDLAPASALPTTRRGAVRGRFCSRCGSIFPRFAARHAGKPMYGKDHVANTCSNEGKSFDAVADWWEPAVEMLPAPEEESGEENT